MLLNLKYMKSRVWGLMIYYLRLNKSFESFYVFRKFTGFNTQYKWQCNPWYCKFMYQQAVKSEMSANCGLISTTTDHSFHIHVVYIGPAISPPPPGPVDHSFASRREGQRFSYRGCTTVTLKRTMLLLLALSRYNVMISSNILDYCLVFIT